MYNKRTSSFVFNHNCIVSFTSLMLSLESFKFFSASLISKEFMEASLRFVHRFVPAQSTPIPIPAINKGVAAPNVIAVATPPAIVRSPPAILPAVPAA